MQLWRDIELIKCQPISSPHRIFMEHSSCPQICFLSNQVHQEVRENLTCWPDNTGFMMFPHLIPIFPSQVWSRLVTAFLHVLPFSWRVWSLESAHACSLSDVMPCDRLRPRWAPRAALPTPLAPPPCPPLPLAHHWAKISLWLLSDARPRTQPLTKGAHWLTGDASPKSAWL